MVGGLATVNGEAAEVMFGSGDLVMEKFQANSRVAVAGTGWWRVRTSSVSYLISDPLSQAPLEMLAIWHDLTGKVLVLK